MQMSCMNQFIFWEELNEFCFLSVEVLKNLVFFPSLLEIKVSNGDFHSDATEEPFLPPQITFFIIVKNMLIV